MKIYPKKFVLNSDNERETKFDRRLVVSDEHIESAVFADGHPKPIHRQQWAPADETISRVFKQWLQWRQLVFILLKRSPNERRFGQTRKLPTTDETRTLSRSSAEMEVIKNF